MHFCVNEGMRLFAVYVRSVSIIILFIFLSRLYTRLQRVKMLNLQDILSAVPYSWGGGGLGSRFVSIFY